LNLSLVSSPELSLRDCDLEARACPILVNQGSLIRPVAMEF
jgi:hypothetical protein